MKIKKVLVANRGEIACRIIKTLRKMDITSVAVYSDIDSNSLHTSIADESIYIGAGHPSNNYLNIEIICNAAIKVGANAIHPGFGFLAENADFAKAVTEAGICFIGPSHDAIRLMGDKLSSKKIASDAGVQVAKGHLGEISSLEEAKQIAQSIGFPILIKAVAGGGGKGMRKVSVMDQIEAAYQVARSEALKSFSDNRIFIEQYIENPRHIEIQILGDKHGQVVCLGERECSIQRRHQKIIEEAPSSFIDHATRTKMYAQSVSLAKRIGYYSAGTVEFVVDEKKNIYFLEMNTRIQVEHPVTELVTGLDIVKEMVEIAEGRHLGYMQDSISIDGYAMEARIYAEDPTNDFFPSTGRLLKYIPPTDDGVRVDSGVREGDMVSMFYDPMIAKVCTHGETRHEALQRMQCALSTFVIHGLNNNILFLESVLTQPKFKNGETTTNFISACYPTGFDPLALDKNSLRLFMVVICYVECINYKALSVYSPKDTELYSVYINGNYYQVRIPYVDMEKNYLHVECEDQLFSVESNYKTSNYIGIFKINGITYPIRVRKVENYFQLSYRGMLCERGYLNYLEAYDLQAFVAKTSRSVQQDKFIAPITGMLVRLMVEEGDIVHKGDPLCTIEAMKMENTFSSEITARIKKLLIKVGSTVQEGDLLIEYDLLGHLSHKEG